MYKLKKIVSTDIFSSQFSKIISHFKKIGCNINQCTVSACLAINRSTFDNFDFLLNCTPAVWTSDSMTDPT